MKLLILEARATVGSIVARIAQQIGWDGIPITSDEGIEKKIKDEDICVLMTENVFPGWTKPLTGLDVVERVRASGLDIPVILFTDQPESVDRTQAEKLRILRILEKPLSIHEVRSALNEAKKLLAPPAAQ